MIDFIEEMREDMMREAREESLCEKQMRDDFDFFIETQDTLPIIKDIQRLIKIADEYGHNRDNIVEWLMEYV